ncbi:MAG: polyprenyl synthetase family protein [Anaerorhabdus sp.]
MNLLDDEYKKLSAKYINSRVHSAMDYSFLMGGKKLRPQLLFAVCNGYGVDKKRAIPFALALEMIHTYSLIHDDLPAMDNDDLRRGKKTCHLEFDEATAILAGDGLLTEAFALIANTEESPEIKINAIQLLTDAAGINGMILGQNFDMESENKVINWEQLKEIHQYKTGKLFAVACTLAALLAQKNHYEKWNKIGIELGLAFQIQDDILDVVKSSADLGKSTSDLANKKSTSVSLLGLDKAKEGAKEYFQLVYHQLNQFDEDMSAVQSLINDIEARGN